MDNIQHILTRVRPPRVRITYDVETGGAIEKKELPFVFALLGDFAGDNLTHMPTPDKRSFITITRENCDDVMAFLSPSCTVAVNGESFALTFERLEHFHPEFLVSRQPFLQNLYEKRVCLVDLLGKIDINRPFEQALHASLNNEENLKTLSEAAKNNKGEDFDTLLEHIIDDEKERVRTCLMTLYAFEEIGGPWDHTQTCVNTMIASVESTLKTYLDGILHHQDVQKMEGSWRGLSYMLERAQAGTQLKVKMLCLSKKELSQDLEKSLAFDQSVLFKKIYEEEYGTLGGEPYACIIADYAWGKDAQDVSVLKKLTSLAAASHAPVMTMAQASIFGLTSYSDLSTPRDLATLFESSEFISWNGLRDLEDARYLSMFLPHVLSRLPYGDKGNRVEKFRYEEEVFEKTIQHFCWFNAAYVMAANIAQAFHKDGWTAAICGSEGGGRVNDLPIYTYESPEGDQRMACPTEIIVTDRREKELSSLGFTPLCYCKSKDYAVFFDAQTVQRAKEYTSDQASANARLSARFPYILTASRFAHYVKVLMRDKVGTFMSKDTIQRYLQSWISQYVLLSDIAPASVKAKHPLREARVDIEEVPGKPGVFRAILYLRPHFQLQELDVSLRLVAELPNTITP